MFEACPNCERALEVDTKEIEKGIFAQVAVCPSCRDEIPLTGGALGNEPLFERRAFQSGGSLAVRIPKEVADALGVRAGTRLAVKPNGKGFFLELTDRRASGARRESS